MQGAFREHLAALAEVGVDASEVRTSVELDACDALVIPGGESTAIRKALVRCGLYGHLRERIESGTPVLATCAGLVVLSAPVEDGAPAAYGLLDVEVERNGFGRQPASFEAPVQLADGPIVPGVFIRAPRILAVGENADVIARLAGGTFADEPVAVRQGSSIACTFHPELTRDRTIHALFTQLVADASSAVTR